MGMAAVVHEVGIHRTQGFETRNEDGKKLSRPTVSWRADCTCGWQDDNTYFDPKLAQAEALSHHRENL